MRRVLPLTIVMGALIWTGAASAFTKTDSVQTMSDGTQVATTLYIPDGAKPTAGWPAVMMAHGLGGSRQDTNALAEAYFVPHGYAVLTWDARGHGQSGGYVDLDGPRQVNDMIELYASLAARPDIDSAQVGGWGISYGGGAIWKATATGLPFAAIETVETWTDLYSALLPQSFSKSGIVGGFLSEIAPGKLDPSLSTLPADAIHSKNLPGLKQLADSRSTFADLPRITTPVFMLQGRRDFAFGMDQAIQAFQKLGGPKRLYLGDHGHAPSSFPAADTPHAMDECVQWFDRFLKGMPNGIDKQPPVEVAANPWKGKSASFAGLPPTKTLVFNAAAKATLARTGTLTQTLGIAKTAIEEFGSPTVTLNVKPNKGFSNVVAVLTATPSGGHATVVSAGGVAISHPGAVTIRMISDATFVPAGSKLQLWIASSTQKTPAGLLYLDFGQPAGSSLGILGATVKVPVLVKPVSG